MVFTVWLPCPMIVLIQAYLAAPFHVYLKVISATLDSFANDAEPLEPFDK